LGTKTVTVAKLRGRFCSFLWGQNRNFVKVTGAKTAIKPYKNTPNIIVDVD